MENRATMETDAVPLVSVIIPTYNRATLLRRALASVRQQTYQNLEVLVVDDASTDDTRAVVAHVADARIRYLRHETNRGGAVARNTGLRAARGAYIAFLDSDDEWLPGKLTAQVAALRSSGQQFCYCQSIITEGTQERVYPQQPYHGGSLLRYLAFDATGGMSTPSFLVEQRVAGLFDETLSVYQDWDWVLQLRQRTDRFLFLPQPLCRIHYDAPTRTRAFAGRSLLDRSRPFLHKYEQELAAQPAVRRFLAWGCALDASARGDRRLTRSILLEFKVFPSLVQRPYAFRIWWKSLVG